MITYGVRNGTFSHTGSVFATGCFSGHGIGFNNPDQESLKGIGPIPRGMWSIGIMQDHPHLGPDVMHLSPLQGTNTFGRTGLFIHGDYMGDLKHDASDGCVVANRSARLLVNAMVERRLQVVD